MFPPLSEFRARMIRFADSVAAEKSVAHLRDQNRSTIFGTEIASGSVT